MKQANIPLHVAIIPDGNRRWARERNLPTLEGHRRGFENIKRLTQKGRDLGIKIMTYWVFSTENWTRVVEEVGYLMRLVEEVIEMQLQEAILESTRIVHIGRKDRLSENLRKKIERAEKETEQFTKYYFVIALDYGGRDEILRVVQKICKEKGGEETVTENDINSRLDTAILPHPEPDLIIRTSGEYRHSGFMVWQSAYSEYYFSPLYFPEFGPEALEKAVIDYRKRIRRFGK